MHKKSPIFYSALLLTGVNLLLRLVGTSFQVYISGKIGAAGVGLLQLVLSVGSLAMTAGTAGIRTAAMYLTAAQLGRKKPENVSCVLSGCFLYSIICSGAVAAVLYIFAPFLAENWISDSRTVGAIRLFACFLPVSCLCGVMTGYFTAAGRIGTLAAVEVAEQLFSMAVTASALTFWAHSDPAKACQSVILGSSAGACVTLILLSILRICEKAKSAKPFPIRRSLLDTALPLALADDLKAGINTAENLMVPKRLALYPKTTDPLATFGVVCGMVFPVLMFPAAILFGLCELLIPEMARCAAAGSQVRIRYLAKRSLNVAMLYGCMFCGLLHLLSQELCIRLYGNLEAGQYLGLYAFLIPMLYCDSVTDAMNKGLGQQKICVRFNIFTSLLDVIFLFLLLPKYGMMGYFFSFLVTHLINFILSLWLLIKTAGIRIKVYTVLGTAAATGLSIMISKFLTNSILSALAYILLLPSLLTLLGILKKENILWIKGLIKGKPDG